jgi:hypothetical protein
MKKAICFLIIISLVIQGGNNMAYARTKKLTDANYSPTIAASESAIRSQVDGSIQEVLDIVETNYASITESKLDKTGNFTGTWHGLTPTQAEPALSAMVEAHLADYAEHIIEYNAFKSDTEVQLISNQIGDFEYEGLLYPDGFPTENLPFTFYRDIDGIIKHDFDFDSFETGAGHIYVDGYAGNDSNDGLTPSTPVALFTVAMAKANALAQDTVVIHILNNIYDQSRFNLTFEYTLGKNIIIKSDAARGKTVMCNAARPTSLTWTVDGTSYKCTRSTVTKVYDTSVNTDTTDYLPKEFTLKSSVAEVQAEEYTWYTDGITVWVHRKDNEPPGNNDIALLYGIYSPLIFNLAGFKLVTRDIQFYMKNSTDDALSVHDTAGTAGGEYWAENCTYALSVSRNGLSTLGVGKSYLFNCIAHSNYLDGFNYHAQSIDVGNVEFMSEYYCKSYNNGDGSLNNVNGTTAHDGYTTLRIGCVGYNSYGPICADVNSCFSVLFDCVMYNSLRTPGPDKAAYDFSSVDGVKEGKAYLINCQGGGTDTYSISADANLPVYIRNFKGKNVYSTTDLHVYY